MPAKVTVTYRRQVGHAALKNFDKERAEFNNKIMRVGVVDKNAQYPDGTKVVDVATWNEFGTDTIPSRPALRNAIKQSAPKLAKEGAVYAKQMLKGKMRFDVAARKLAKMLVGYMQASIITMDTPENAPSTIARKGFNNPLIETKLYLKSITFKLTRTRKDQK